MNALTGSWALIIFTRWPEAGRTKTRLIPAYGAAGAAHIHRQLISRTARAARQLVSQTRILVAVADAPDAANSLLIPEAWPQIAQRGGDLGERMANAFDDTFTRFADCDSAVLIGVDCPDYTSALFERAADSLNAHATVYAPTEDGGYGLVGVRRDVWSLQLRGAMFEHIPWGTANVMQTSLARVNAQALAENRKEAFVALLQTLWDVDTPADVVRAIEAGVISLPS
jgi:uncharacterized protein